MRHKICNVTQLTELLHIPQSTVLQHLSKMKGKILSGLEMYYRIQNFKVCQFGKLFPEILKFLHQNQFTSAREHYNKAEELLNHIPDEIEHGEFYFKLSTFDYKRI
ncbi:Regulatory protein ArsR [Bacillus cytotoxicus]|nr:Regulatory protein ArsR [Bacillus cytotoxicus]